MNRADTGRLGELEAARFLERNGYRILERNFRCRSGEIDIIARQGDTLVFVEVKTRAGEAFGSPEESVGGGKQRRMALAASYYLEKTGCHDTDARFDVVAVELKEGRFECRLIRDAFESGLD